MMDHGAAVYVMLVRAEAASNLARFDGIRYRFQEVLMRKRLLRSIQSPVMKDLVWKLNLRILIGNYVLSVGHADAYYNGAEIVQGLMRQEFMNAFEEVDLLFAPVVRLLPSSLVPLHKSWIQMDLQGYFTAPAHILQEYQHRVLHADLPRKLTNQDFGSIGPDLSEAHIYQAAYAYEQRTPWHTMKPTLVKE